MPGVTLTAEERCDALERRIADLEFDFDVASVRREAIERNVAALQSPRPLEVRDLPVAALIRKLEMLGQLSASCLEPGTITPNLLASAVT